MKADSANRRTLRNRLLALSLLTLLLPWSGWKLLQELEIFLREAQEATLITAAQTAADTLPFEIQSLLRYPPKHYLLVRPLAGNPALDGFTDEWPEPSTAVRTPSGDGRYQVELLAGSAGTALSLAIKAERNTDHASNQGRPAGVMGESAIELLLRSPRGLQRFNIHPEAPGRLQLQGEGGSGQAEGYWRDTPTGFQLELTVPVSARDADIQVRLNALGETVAQPAAEWISLVMPSPGLAAQLAAISPAGTRAWLVDGQGWVLADSGAEQSAGSPQTTWLQRLLYRLVAGSRTEMKPAGPEIPVRLQDKVIVQALSATPSDQDDRDDVSWLVEGMQRQAHTTWTQEPDTAIVRNTVAVPVQMDGRARGAVVLESASDGLLLVTNRALGRLMLTTLVITFGLAGGLWWFATRLSQRVRRLSAAVSVAMENGDGNGQSAAHGHNGNRLPLVDDRDELGALARNNQKLLRAVADYNQYLQTLAGKLSHELKTPLAITRSSLENLSSLPLDEDAQRFLQRAREGVERQASMVRAMSEASRLEASIGMAEWVETDVTGLLNQCAEGYRAVHPDRHIETRLPESARPILCAPELLAQALDKLVDNALSFCGPDDTVTIRLESTADGVEISVRNTGSSLPDSYQDRLFDSLVSVREKHDEMPHLGLGLYIVKLVANAHRGSVSAQNVSAGNGVVFSLNIPG